MGDSKKLLVASGIGSEAAPFCGSATAALAEMEPEDVFPLAHGFRWSMVVHREEPGLDPVRLRIVLNRTEARLGDAREVVTREIRLALRFGDRRLLDFVEFQPPNDHPSCQIESTQIELEVRPRPWPEAWDRRLRYEVWFAQTRDGEREEFVQFSSVAEQAEEVTFRLRSLDRRLVLSDRADDPTILLESLSRGTVRAWSTGEETVAIQLNPNLHHQVDGSEMLGEVSSGRGSKLYEARLGETVEVELPPVTASLNLFWSGLTLEGATVDGVKVAGDGRVALDLSQLLRDTTFSLLVRVTLGS